MTARVTQAKTGFPSLGWAANYEKNKENGNSYVLQKLINYTSEEYVVSSPLSEVIIAKAISFSFR
jgi:hypothetical protein